MKIWTKYGMGVALGALLLGMPAAMADDEKIVVSSLFQESPRGAITLSVSRTSRRSPLWFVGSFPWITLSLALPNPKLLAARLHPGRNTATRTSTSPKRSASFFFTSTNPVRRSDSASTTTRSRTREDSSDPRPAKPSRQDGAFRRYS